MAGDLRAIFRSRWTRRVALGVGLWLVYTANGREVGSGDTVPAVLQPIGIARGDGLAIDRFAPVLRALDPSGPFPPYYASIRHGRLVSRYAVMPVLVTLPLVLPQVALLDARRPGWDATAASTLWHGRRMAKNASAAVAALTAVLLLEILLGLGLDRAAWPATIVVALGSPLWVTAAQSAWHHGPAVLAFTAAVLLLLRSSRPGALLATGAALAIMVASRLPTVVFALPVAGWVLWRRPRSAGWLLLPLALGGGLLLAYNLFVFGSPIGGQSELESMRLPMHAVPGSWGDPVAGAAGTLLSPSRGLLVFCPWVAATLVVLPITGARLGAVPIVPVLVAGLVAHLLLFASYSAWWAGWCFGARYWTEAVPVLGILYALALDAARARAAWTRALLYGAGLLAVGVHTLGAGCYPSTWNASPTNVDVHHERLWDWRDTELTREMREGPHPREFPRVPW